MKNKQWSPYLSFTRADWLKFRQDMPLTLSESDLASLHGQVETVSMQEVIEVYLPLSRLLSLYVTATQELHRVTSDFLGRPAPKVPYIIGVAGSVAVGKSTTSRVLQTLLSHWPNHPHVALLTTDGFLYPLQTLQKMNLLNRKGFPESYDVAQLLELLHNVKAGMHGLKAPVYSHHLYDVVPDEYVTIEQPDILIVEGLNILQTGVAAGAKPASAFVSDYFDFSIFVDAEIASIRQWYIDRVNLFYHTTFREPGSYFHHLTKLAPKQLIEFAEQVWREINEVNLLENILPYKNRADLILHKNSLHRVDKVKLRKL